MRTISLHRRHLLGLAAACAAVALAGCSRPTTVASTWHTQATVGPYSRLLVIGVTEDINRRRLFEDTLVDALQRSGNQAFASGREMEVGEPVNRDTVAAVVRRLDADAVLVTRIVAREVKADEVAGRSGVKTRRKDEYAYDFFRYDYEEYQEPGSLVVTADVGLATDLYETVQGELVYSIETLSYAKEDVYDVVDDVAPIIARRLRRDGLIR